MCFPAAIPIAIAAVSVVSAVAKNNDAKRQAATMRQQSEAEYQEAESANADQRAQVNARASDQMSARARAASLERGRLSAIAADSGIEGNSVDRLVRQSYFNEGFDVTSIEVNRENSQTQLSHNLRSAKLTENRQMAAYKQPSGLGATLSIIGSGLQAYGAMGGGTPAPSLIQDQVPGQYSTVNRQYG